MPLPALLLVPLPALQVLPLTLPRTLVLPLPTPPTKLLMLPSRLLTLLPALLRATSNSECRGAATLSAFLKNRVFGCGFFMPECCAIRLRLQA